MSGQETAASLNTRGMHLTEAERFDEAVEAFSMALELEPGNTGLLYNRGEAYRRAGKSAQASTDLEAVLAIEGEAPDLLLALGLVAYEADDFDTAERRYERALVLKSNFPEAWNDLGVIKFRQERYKEAKKCFERAVEYRSGYEEAWFNLADTYDELGLEVERKRARDRLRELGADRREEED